MRRKLAVAGALTAGFIAGGYLLYRVTRPSAEDVMADFYAAEERAEDMLMDPLILNADQVAPAVIEKVQDRRMEKRRYAILFLGNQRIRDALPVLRRILNDETERDYFRADALEAVFMIDAEEGTGLAHSYSPCEDFLGYMARGLLDGSCVRERRTWWQALTGHHE